VDRYSRFFLQHRSLGKETFPGLWDTAVGGHVTYGELYQEALIREAGEELGFYDFNPQYLDNYIYETDNDREMIGLYVAVGSFDLHPDNYEVSEGRYWSLEEIDANLGKGVFTPEFENEYALYKDKILALL
jgi:isopentenyldiphosphate isomerase